jgi:hypothetical protein
MLLYRRKKYGQIHGQKGIVEFGVNIAYWQGSAEKMALISVPDPGGICPHTAMFMGVAKNQRITQR